MGLQFGDFVWAGSKLGVFLYRDLDGIYNVYVSDSNGLDGYIQQVEVITTTGRSIHDVKEENYVAA